MVGGSKIFKAFKNICVQAAVEELARKDDLTLLFSAISSVCPQHNLIWRKVRT